MAKKRKFINDLNKKLRELESAVAHLGVGIGVDAIVLVALRIRHELRDVHADGRELGPGQIQDGGRRVRITSQDPRVLDEHGGGHVHAGVDGTEVRVVRLEHPIIAPGG